MFAIEVGLDTADRRDLEAMSTWEVSRQERTD